MKLKHINSGEVFDTFPHWYKWNSIYGYLVPVENKVLFFFVNFLDEVRYEDITGEFENLDILSTKHFVHD